MNRLPTEIQDDILSYCNHTDRLYARLVNKTFAAICEPSVFRHVSICLFRFSFDRLGAIARSRFAEHVKRVTIYTNRLSDSPKEGAIRSRLGHPYHAHLRAVKPLKPNWSTTWGTYQALLAQQKEVVEATEQSLLWKPFELLPSLDEINVANFSVGPSYPPDTSKVPWNRPSLDLVRGVVFFVKNTDLIYDNWAVSSVLDALVRRSNVQTTSIRSLSIDCHLTTGFLSHHKDHVMPESRDAQSGNLIQAMRGLEEFRFVPTFIDGRKSSLGEHMIELLSHCHELRHLTLQYASKLPPNRQNLRKFAPMTSLLGLDPTPWPKLQSLRLMAHALNKDMFTFLQQHSHNLKHLSIQCSAFNDALAILDSIPKCLHLSSIDLSELYSWDNYPGQSLNGYDLCYFPDAELSPEVRQWFLTGVEPPPHWALSPLIDDVEQCCVSEEEEDDDDDDEDNVHDWQDWSMRTEIVR